MKLELQSQDQTEIYASDRGYCCISQTGPEAEVVILIAPNQVDDLCRMLQSVKDQAIKNRAEYLQEEEER